MGLRRRESGQASVELVAVLPVVAALLAGLAQATVAGQAAWVAGSAARAAARAQAIGLNPVAAARESLPAHLEPGLLVRPDADGGITVRVAVPAVLGPGRVGSIGARARMEPQGP